MEEELDETTEDQTTDTATGTSEPVSESVSTPEEKDDYDPRKDAPRNTFCAWDFV